MMCSLKAKRKMSRKQGSNVILTIGLLFVMLFCGGVAVDTAFYFGAHQGMQNAADSSALAAASAFVKSTSPTLNGRESDAITAAQTLAYSNRYQLNTSDVIFGYVDPGNPASFTTTPSNNAAYASTGGYNAIATMVKAGNGQANSPVPTIFNTIFGVNGNNALASSVAMVNGVGSVTGLRPLGLCAGAYNQAVSQFGNASVPLVTFSNNSYTLTDPQGNVTVGNSNCTSRGNVSFLNLGQGTSPQAIASAMQNGSSNSIGVDTNWDTIPVSSVPSAGSALQPIQNKSVPVALYQDVSQGPVSLTTITNFNMSAFAADGSSVAGHFNGSTITNTAMAAAPMPLTGDFSLKLASAGTAPGGGSGGSGGGGSVGSTPQTVVAFSSEYSNQPGGQQNPLFGSNWWGFTGTMNIGNGASLLVQNGTSWLAAVGSHTQIHGSSDYTLDQAILNITGSNNPYVTQANPEMLATQFYFVNNQGLTDSVPFQNILNNSTFQTNSSDSTLAQFNGQPLTNVIANLPSSGTSFGNVVQSALNSDKNSNPNGYTTANLTAYNTLSIISNELIITKGNPPSLVYTDPSSGQTYNIIATFFCPVKVSLNGLDAQVNSSNHFFVSLNGLNHQKDKPYVIQTAGGLNTNEAWLAVDRESNGFFRGPVTDGNDLFGDHLGKYKTGYEDLANMFKAELKKDSHGKSYIPLRHLSWWECLWIWLTRLFGFNKNWNASYDLKLITVDHKVIDASQVLSQVYVNYTNVSEWDSLHKNVIRQRAMVQYTNGKTAQSADQWYQAGMMLTPMTENSMH